MKVHIQTRVGETVIREIEVGSNLTGLRITALIIESGGELHKILEPRGQEWLKDNVHRFAPYVSSKPRAPIDKPPQL